MSETAVPTDIKAKVRQRKKEADKLPWRKVSFFVLRLAFRHPFLLGLAFLLILVLAGLEIFNFSLIIPFIEALGGGGLSEETPLGFMAGFFEGLSTVDRIRLIAVFLVLSAVVGGLLTYGLSRLIAYVAILIDRDVRQMLFDETMGADLSYIQRQKTANLFTIMHSFPGAVVKITNEYIKGVQNLASFIGLSVALILISWQMTVLAAVIGLIVTLIVVQLSGIIARVAARIRDERVELHRHTFESLQSVKVVRQFAREDDVRDHYNKSLSGLRRSQFKKSGLDALVTPLQSTLSSFLGAAILVGATFILVQSGEAWVALLALYFAVVARFQSRAGKYAKRRTTIAGELPEVEAILDYLDEPKRMFRDGTEEAPRLRDAIRFEGVRFAYGPDEPEAIKGVDLEIRKGSMVALVGTSGAGKTTLVDLLTRMYDPTAGRILVDGKDLKGFKAHTWRRRCAVVSQDSFLFNTTVRENIRYGRPAATDEEVEEAARVANADGFIKRLPNGYDTIIGERGTLLSGGQAQRISIARAVLVDPEVLILDEATSALDAATELLVQEAIDRIGKDRTTVAIAHRLSTVQKADRIFVLEDGKVVEAGPHRELIAKGGRYADFVRMQDLGRTASVNGAVEELWVSIRLHREPRNVVAMLRDMQDVVTVRSHDRLVQVVTDGDPKVLPEVLRKIGSAGHRVESIRVSGTSDGQVRPLLDSTQESTWFRIGGTGINERLLERVKDEKDVAFASLRDGFLEVALYEARHTFPAFLRMLGRRKVRVDTISVGGPPGPAPVVQVATRRRRRVKA